ncbi:hypothetical protein [Cupriavidus pinatubonensis]|uniref:Aminoglycoside phosphotransferase domain-containing protein n=1 Tax=Cupriavidus pinatubonensis TaxID=248026 RepID=A0ABM8XYS4_9BURK|nr:hypothetical protein [Cupriavidus pinatubonensis]CAG9185588.1 hypothetical protein LMG23994_05800 [Cupriavidus pinatubonensis]
MARNGAAVPDDSMPVASKVALLRQPGLYPDHPRDVEVVETHMSWVFLTRDYAYKLKKPVRYDYLDFRTLAARQYYCTEEVRLNRRLAGSVYLDVVPMVLEPGGTARFGGKGAVVDWLVKMRRLPADRMLDKALSQGTATQEDARAVATRLGEFYMTLPPAPVTVDEYRGRLRRDIDDCERELSNPAFAQPVALVREVCLAQRRLLAQDPSRFDQRVKEGRIVEAHGDLRPEHICLAPPLAIIDCLEFSRQFRTLDTANEIGFLALECERLGDSDFARVLIGTYRDVTGDRPDAALLHFYQSCSACLRAKITVWHLREAIYRDSPKWPERARCYLRLAEQHMQACAQAYSHEGVIPPAVR